MKGFVPDIKIRRAKVQSQQIVPNVFKTGCYEGNLPVNSIEKFL